MKTNDAIKRIAINADMSLIAVSKSMGRNENYLAATLSRGSVPKADTLSAIANTCGYALALIPRESLPDDAIVIDAPGD